MRIECSDLTCRVGPGCGDCPWAAYTSAQVNLTVAVSKGKGCGAFTLERIKKGDIVREYAGAIISSKAKKKRYKSTLGKYVMTYGNRKFIDASRYGNASRFVNRSYVSNCEADEWTVSGAFRIGVVAIKDIGRGGEITFAYGGCYTLPNCLCRKCTD
ncbi:hypothetical protein JG688_00016238 [Phytophthora aleatoria]|uniref:SET domain-containing protein n=1 Tax=Phytophthora aleatoria TaxID=2496075 RepID=A0A8J5IUJ2_9STRA|nr:hypothetical protein JG688_00016238 [Phytophthora aleatoria]